jgi:colanic acid/amylovoran biosynthesis glycosyltransferase
MRILMYCNKFGGPTTTFIQNDLLQLTKNHQVKHLSTVLDKDGSFRYSDVDIVPYYRDLFTAKVYWILEKRGWYLSYKNKSFAKKVNEIVDSFNPDIILCNFGIEALVLTDNLNEQNKKRPIVINFLGYDASFHLNRPSYVSKLMELSGLSNVFATSNTNFLKKNLEVKGVFFRENKVIHTGINLTFFDRKGYIPKQDKYIFLQIALLSYRKGQDVAIYAFKKMLSMVPDPGKYKLILAGGGEPGIGELIRMIPVRLGIESQVEFTNWITPLEAKQLMMEANCFLHHSKTINWRTEGVPTAVSEAMAMELPIISTWHAGIPELVEEGENGFLVEENDIEMFAKRMIDIQSWGYKSNNREKVEKYFNIEKRGEALNNYFDEILLRQKKNI